MKETIGVLCAAALLSASSLPAEAADAMPDKPEAGRDFVLHLGGYVDSCSAPTTTPTVSVADQTITVAYRTDGGVCPSNTAGQYINVLANVPSAGTFRVVQKSLSNEKTRDEGLLVVFPSTPAASRTSTSLAGLWYVPAQPGWGLNIAEGASGQLFVTWFTYGLIVASFPSGITVTEGGTWFFTSGGKWTSSSEFTGLLAKSTGSDFQQPFTPSSFRANPIGSTTLAITGPDTLTFSVQYAFDNGVKSQAFNLTRYKF